ARPIFLHFTSPRSKKVNPFSPQTPYESAPLQNPPRAPPSSCSSYLRDKKNEHPHCHSHNIIEQRINRRAAAAVTPHIRRNLRNTIAARCALVHIAVTQVDGRNTRVRQRNQFPRLRDPVPIVTKQPQLRKNRIVPVNHAIPIAIEAP